MTKSRGSSPKAKAYRAKQKQLIEQGRFDDAFLMDVNDLRSQWPDGKYDEAILEAIDKLPR